MMKPTKQKSLCFLKMLKRNIQTQKEKKQIVKDLANNLEGKIPTDTISIEIVNQLRDKVSERFIHNCLDEKYKQKSQVENARRQKKVSKFTRRKAERE